MGRSTIILGTLLASTALVSPALAQDAGTETTPNEQQQLDENGVDPATGLQLAYSTDLSIGPSGPGGLRLVRGRGQTGNQSNIVFYLNGDPNLQMTAAIGLKSIVFDKVGSDWVPNDGSAATMVKNSATRIC